MTTPTWKQRAAAAAKKQEFKSRVTAATTLTPEQQREALRARVEFAVAFSEAVTLASTVAEFNLIQQAAGLRP